MTWKQFTELPAREKDILISKAIDAKEIVKDGIHIYFEGSPLAEVPRYTKSERCIGRMINIILRSGYTLEMNFTDNITKGRHIIKVRNREFGIVLHHYDVNILIGAAVLFVNGQLYYE